MLSFHKNIIVGNYLHYLHCAKAFVAIKISFSSIPCLRRDRVQCILGDSSTTFFHRPALGFLENISALFLS